MSRYVQLYELKGYLGFEGTLGAAQEWMMQDALDDAEDAIDTHCRRSFVGTAGTAYYSRFWQDKVVGQQLYLDQDLHTLTGLLNGDSTTIPLGSVWTEPRNAGPPYRILRLKSSYAWVWNTDSDVVVSGTFGYGTVAPDAIRRATIRLAAYYFRLKDVGPGDVSGFPEGGEVTYPKGIPDDVKIILEKYRSRSGGAI